MKVTKSQLKRIIKEELNELTSVEETQRLTLSGTEWKAVDVIKPHLEKIIAELAESGISPYREPTAHTGAPDPDLEAMAIEVYSMIANDSKRNRNSINEA
jgi:hypothetical protein